MNPLTKQLVIDFGIVLCVAVVYAGLTSGCAVSVDMPPAPATDAGSDAAEPEVTYSVPEAGELAPARPVYCELADGGIGLCSEVGR